MGEAKINLDSKKEAFDKDPNRFVDLNDIIVGAIRQRDTNGNDGVGVVVSQSAGDVMLKAVAFDLQRQVNFVLDKREYMREANRIKNEKKIIVPDGEIIREN